MPTASDYENIPALIAALFPPPSALLAGPFTSITTINNISNQVIQISYSRISTQKASANSDLAPSKSGQLIMQSGKSIRIETSRIDVGQLDQLRRKRVLSYVTSNN